VHHKTNNKCIAIANNVNKNKQNEKKGKTFFVPNPDA